MSSTKPLYHELTRRQLAAISPGSHSYVFVGPSGSGRQLAATALAKRLNCPKGGDDDCQICRSITAGGFADLHLVSSATALGIENIQAIQQTLAQRPFSPATTRIVIIDTDLGISPAAQNRLLKTLEEPPAQTILVLLAEHLSALLPTIQSRCRLINFLPLRSQAMSDYLVALIGAQAATDIMQLRPASVGEAIKLAKDQDFRSELQSNVTLAKSFLAASLFERLAMAQSQKAKLAVAALIDCVARLGRDLTLPPKAFAALEEAQAALQANVGPRTVMEALALSL